MKPAGPLTILRSLLFVIWMYGTMMIIGFAVIWLLLFPRSWSRAVFRFWLGLIFGGLKYICGQTYEVRGQENLPEGGALIASRHESMMETQAFWQILEDPAIILKKELAWLPVFGWFAMKLGNIVVDRGAAAKALRKMLRDARDRAAEGRQILIFPEGTRMKPGQFDDLKPGVAGLYNAMEVPCVPVALDSGDYWSGRGIIRRPGKAVIQFLEPIAPGLSRDDFMKTLQSRIQDGTRALRANRA
ncbi:lysophospholipid acyltransferase family protein [Hyphobacterium sp. HN65]|uniref:Lysophospholipid acyltransferase family protein n=1 Tax=Hyphobacterium lacteum TaxID=3116575 RepID=A0ABU7LQ17_9PROT|nr:lysophospholipid acyltransferase family protein [Hyphobacterium sp. HN65]MEE2526000.1 lysophospholipid acyltransferase family protein [Hyphobacterium sp. HN65]